MKKKFSILAVLWGLLILFMTLIPGHSVPSWEILSFDKLGHFGLFGILSFLAANSLGKESSRENLKKNVFVYSVVGATGYGILIELIQSQVPGRYASFYDVVANTIGAFLGFWFFRLTDKFLKARKEK